MQQRWGRFQFFPSQRAIHFAYKRVYFVVYPDVVLKKPGSSMQPLITAV